MCSVVYGVFYIPAQISWLSLFETPFLLLQTFVIHILTKRQLNLSLQVCFHIIMPADYLTTAMQVAHLFGSEVTVGDPRKQGADHEPLFTCEVKISLPSGEIIQGTGRGMSSKNAKHDAARDFLHYCLTNHAQQFIKILDDDENYCLKRLRPLHGNREQSKF